jgi:hypothetical protein
LAARAQGPETEARGAHSPIGSIGILDDERYAVSRSAARLIVYLEFKPGGEAIRNLLFANTLDMRSVLEVNGCRFRVDRVSIRQAEHGVPLVVLESGAAI